MPPSIPGQSPLPENFVLKISKPGFDVRSATDAQLQFNSNQDIFKIVLTGTLASIATSGPTTTTTIAHNLGYIPAVLAFTVVGGLYRSTPYVQMNTADGSISYYTYASADDTNLYIIFQYNNGV